MSTTAQAARALRLKEIYIGRGRDKEVASLYVQNIGRNRFGCRWPEQPSQTARHIGCAMGGIVATDVMSMQTGLLRAVGDAD